MKKTPLKRIGKNPIRKLKLKADIALQNFYRTKGEKCLICIKPAELQHHFILKSMCNRLRYEKINLIPLCKSCHFRAHFGNSNFIGGQIVYIKGKKWLDKIRRLEKEHISLTRKYLEEIIERYKI